MLTIDVTNTTMYDISEVYSKIRAIDHRFNMRQLWVNMAQKSRRKYQLDTLTHLHNYDMAVDQYYQNHARKSFGSLNLSFHRWLHRYRWRNLNTLLVRKCRLVCYVKIEEMLEGKRSETRRGKWKRLSQTLIKRDHYTRLILDMQALYNFRNLRSSYYYWRDKISLDRIRNRVKWRKMMNDIQKNNVPPKCTDRIRNILNFEKLVNDYRHKRMREHQISYRNWDKLCKKIQNKYNIDVIHQKYNEWKENKEAKRNLLNLSYQKWLYRYIMKNATSSLTSSFEMALVSYNVSFQHQSAQMIQNSFRNYKNKKFFRKYLDKKQSCSISNQFKEFIQPGYDFWISYSHKELTYIYDLELVDIPNNLNKIDINEINFYPLPIDFFEILLAPLDKLNRTNANIDEENEKLLDDDFCSNVYNSQSALPTNQSRVKNKKSKRKRIKEPEFFEFDPLATYIAPPITHNIISIPKFRLNNDFNLDLPIIDFEYKDIPKPAANEEIHFLLSMKRWPIPLLYYLLKSLPKPTHNLNELCNPIEPFLEVNQPNINIDQKPHIAKDNDDFIFQPPKIFQFNVNLPKIRIKPKERFPSSINNNFIQKSLSNIDLLDLYHDLNEFDDMPEKNILSDEIKYLVNVPNVQYNHSSVPKSILSKSIKPPLNLFPYYFGPLPRIELLSKKIPSKVNEKDISNIIYAKFLIDNEYKEIFPIFNHSFGSYQKVNIPKQKEDIGLITMEMSPYRFNLQKIYINPKCIPSPCQPNLVNDVAIESNCNNQEEINWELSILPFTDFIIPIFNYSKKHLPQRHKDPIVDKLSENIDDKSDLDMINMEPLIDLDFQGLTLQPVINHLPYTERFVEESLIYEPCLLQYIYDLPRIDISPKSQPNKTPECVIKSLLSNNSIELEDYDQFLLPHVSLELKEIPSPIKTDLIERSTPQSHLNDFTDINISKMNFTPPSQISTEVISNATKFDQDVKFEIVLPKVSIQQQEHLLPSINIDEENIDSNAISLPFIQIAPQSKAFEPCISLLLNLMNFPVQIDPKFLEGYEKKDPLGYINNNEIHEYALKLVFDYDLPLEKNDVDSEALEEITQDILDNEVFKEITKYEENELLDQLLPREPVTYFTPDAPDAVADLFLEEIKLPLVPNEPSEEIVAEIADVLESEQAISKISDQSKLDKLRNINVKDPESFYSYHESEDVVTNLLNHIELPLVPNEPSNDQIKEISDLIDEKSAIQEIIPTKNISKLSELVKKDPESLFSYEESENLALGMFLHFDLPLVLNVPADKDINDISKLFNSNDIINAVATSIPINRLHSLEKKDPQSMFSYEESENLLLGMFLHFDLPLVNNVPSHEEIDEIADYIEVKEIISDYAKLKEAQKLHSLEKKDPESMFSYENAENLVLGLFIHYDIPLIPNIATEEDIKEISEIFDLDTIVNEFSIQQNHLKLQEIDRKDPESMFSYEEAENLILGMFLHLDIPLVPNVVTNEEINEIADIIGMDSLINDFSSISKDAAKLQEFQMRDPESMFSYEDSESLALGLFLLYDLPLIPNTPTDDIINEIAKIWEDEPRIVETNVNYIEHLKMKDPESLYSHTESEKKANEMLNTICLPLIPNEPSTNQIKEIYPDTHGIILEDIFRCDLITLNNFVAKEPESMFSFEDSENLALGLFLLFDLPIVPNVIDSDLPNDIVGNMELDNSIQVLSHNDVMPLNNIEPRDVVSYIPANVDDEIAESMFEQVDLPIIPNIPNILAIQEISDCFETFPLLNKVAITDVTRLVKIESKPVETLFNCEEITNSILDSTDLPIVPNAFNVDDIFELNEFDDSISIIPAPKVDDLLILEPREVVSYFDPIVPEEIAKILLKYVDIPIVENIVTEKDIIDIVQEPDPSVHEFAKSDISSILRIEPKTVVIFIPDEEIEEFVESTIIKYMSIPLIPNDVDDDALENIIDDIFDDNIKTINQTRANALEQLQPRDVLAYVSPASIDQLAEYFLEINELPIVKNEFDFEEDFDLDVIFDELSNTNIESIVNFHHVPLPDNKLVDALALYLFLEVDFPITANEFDEEVDLELELEEVTKELKPDEMKYIMNIVPRDVISYIPDVDSIAEMLLQQIDLPLCPNTADITVVEDIVDDIFIFEENYVPKLEPIIELTPVLGKSINDELMRLFDESISVFPLIPNDIDEQLPVDVANDLLELDIEDEIVKFNIDCLVNMEEKWIPIQINDEFFDKLIDKLLRKYILPKIRFDISLDPNIPSEIFDETVLDDITDDIICTSNVMNFLLKFRSDEIEDNTSIASDIVTQDVLWNYALSDLMLFESMNPHKPLP